MQPEIEFKGEFEASPKMMMVPAAWFLGFRCDACDEYFAVFDEPTGTGNVKLGGSGTFRIECPHCGETRAYPATRMQAFQATTGRSTAYQP